ncbi:MAG: hypothetical protein SGPRY_013605, partial [Prymnesium sp.]
SLDVPSTVPLKQAVEQMSEMMGLPSVCEGMAIPLPETVSALMRVLGMQVADDEEGGNQHEAPSEASSSTSDPSKALQRAWPPPISLCLHPTHALPAMYSGGVGSYFGQAVVKKYDKGKLVDVAVAEAQPEFATEQRAAVVCACGKEFSWKSAWLIHAKLCNKFVEPEPVQTEALVREAEKNDDSDEEASPAPPSKKLRTDGRPKESGLREGQCRTPNTLMFKYQVAQEFEHLNGLKTQGLIKDPLIRTSEIFHDLSVSNIWNWYAKLEKMRFALTHETSGCRVQKNRVDQLVGMKSQTEPASREAMLLRRCAEDELYSKFRAHRKLGKRVNERWLTISTMRKLIRELYCDAPADEFKGSYGGRANNHKNQSVEERLPKIKCWHARLRPRVNDAPRENLHPKWGKWLPENRLSIDQGVRIAAQERAAWHPDVHVRFQPKTCNGLHAGTDTDGVELGADPEETALLSSEVTHADDEGADDADEEEEQPYVDSSDDEDDTAELVIDIVGWAQSEPPDGFKYVLDVPPLETDADLLNLVGKSILDAFDEKAIMGWFRGKIVARGVSNRDKVRTPTANCVVAYDKRITKNKDLHGRVASSLVVSKYGLKEWWILLEPK